MSLVIFIDEQTLKDYTIISDNVDFKQLRPEIISIQDLYIQDLIGSGLYKELKTQVTANTVTVLNQTLLNDYIQPTLIWRIMSESPLALSFKYTNKGIVNKTGEASVMPSMGDMANIIGKYQERSESYAEKLVNYLIQNSTLYPLYFNPGSGVDTVYPRRRVFTTGFAMGTTTRLTLDLATRYQGNYDLLCDDCYSTYGKF
jgi:hypothetical protein